MAVRDRTLEEDEAKIDNLLHKILESNDKIDSLAEQVRQKSDDGFVMQRMRMMSILTETIKNLAILADEIDLRDEELVKELEHNVKSELRQAVQRIEQELIGIGAQLPGQGASAAPLAPGQHESDLLFGLPPDRAQIDFLNVFPNVDEVLASGHYFNKGSIEPHSSGVSSASLNAFTHFSMRSVSKLG